MSFELTFDEYGKSQNRLMRVVRDTERHVIRDLSVDVWLQGDFAHVYLEGDNTEIPATDTMKNTVFGLGKTDFSTGSIEDFAKTLIAHYVKTSPRVSSARVEITEFPWVRIPEDAVGSDHTFFRGSSGNHLTWVEGDGDTFKVTSGINDLFVLKSTRSGFVGFERTQFTSLPEVTDRILATVIDAKWTYAGEVEDYQASWEAIHDVLIRRFADHYSDSVQQTIYNICTAILEARPEVHEVTIKLPNKHHNLVDLEVFGLDNPGEVFIATQDPFGHILGTVTRTAD